MTCHRWNRVSFTISLDLSAERGQLIDSDGKPVDCLTIPAGCPEGECVTLELDCESSGYCDSGHTYGPPENCYPPEYEDERDIVSARLLHPAGVVELPRELFGDLYARFQSRIEAEEIDTTADHADYGRDE